MPILVEFFTGAQEYEDGEMPAGTALLEMAHECERSRAVEKSLRVVLEYRKLQRPRWFSVPQA